ncbi:hypothetical protein TNCV_4027161 [Trichonephila clavipes]|nr:hypothetical protein TNCV_4027161 [Trichonephila clavipes]
MIGPILWQANESDLKNPSTAVQNNHILVWPLEFTVPYTIIRSMSATGHYGIRVPAFVCDSESSSLPPYSSVSQAAERVPFGGRVALRGGRAYRKVQNKDLK